MKTDCTVLIELKICTRIKIELLFNMIKFRMTDDIFYEYTNYFIEIFIGKPCKFQRKRLQRARAIVFEFDQFQAYHLYMAEVMQSVYPAY